MEVQSLSKYEYKYTELSEEQISTEKISTCIHYTLVWVSNWRIHNPFVWPSELISTTGNYIML